MEFAGDDKGESLRPDKIIYLFLTWSSGAHFWVAGGHQPWAALKTETQVAPKLKQLDESVAQKRT